VHDPPRILIVDDNATNRDILATGLRCSHTDQSKGDYHAREVLRLDDTCRHCCGRCQRRHFGAHHTDAGSGSIEFCHCAGPNAENALGPSCASMIDRQIDKPIPMPFDFVVKNDSKMNWCMSQTAAARRACQGWPRLRGHQD
jgi:hypothetical protein